MSEVNICVGQEVILYVKIVQSIGLILYDSY